MCPQCGHQLQAPRQPPDRARQGCAVVALVAVAILGVMFLVTLREGSHPSGPAYRVSEPSFGRNAYSDLTTEERSSCDAVATQAERFAGGREAGMSLETQLTAAAVACKEHPDSNAACKTFPELARRVHAEKWTAADAADRVKKDCRSWIYK